jgi:hypothetical protein
VSPALPAGPGLDHSGRGRVFCCGADRPPQLARVVNRVRWRRPAQRSRRRGRASTERLAAVGAERSVPGDLVALADPPNLPVPCRVDVRGGVQDVRGEDAVSLVGEGARVRLGVTPSKRSNRKSTSAGPGSQSKRCRCVIFGPIPHPPGRAQWTRGDHRSCHCTTGVAQGFSTLPALFIAKTQRCNFLGGSLIITRCG